MGIKQILTDDLTGQELPDDTKAQTVTFEGKKYDVYLSASSTERFVSFLNGETPLTSSPRTAAKKTTGTRNVTTVDTYGYPTKEVREWWGQNEVDGKKGGDRGRIPQAVYDAFKAAQWEDGKK